MDSPDSSSTSGSGSAASGIVLTRSYHGERRFRGSVVCLDPYEPADSSADDEPYQGDDSAGSERGAGESNAAATTRAGPALALPGIPSFRHLQQPWPCHVGRPILPRDLTLGSVSPLQLFQEVFTDEVLRVVAENTNKYAYTRIAADRSGHLWRVITVRELKVWIALAILIGVARVRSLPEFWSTDERRGVFKASKFMSMKQFRLIKRYLHVSDPTQDCPFWYSKVEPLASHCRGAFKRLYLPGSDVSVDEMVARFSGRSAHTFRIKGKPTPEGYKILALCEHGYTYDFLFTSRVEKTPASEPVRGLNAIGNQVWQLVKSLPANRAFNVYMDNYFSSIPLFKHLRDNNIGACGTVRTNSAKFPKELKVSKNSRLDWNTIAGKVVDDVLAVLWVDNAPVTMLTTIHRLGGEDWTMQRKRRRPRETSTNAATVRRVFGDQPTMVLGIPKIIDDYNHKMNGVDIADQLRAYRCLQQTSRRTWYPLFFWLLDTTLVNLSILHAKLGTTISNTDFRVGLAWDLLRATATEQERRVTRSMEEPDISEPPTKRVRAVYITKAFTLPESRFLPGDHFPEYRPVRQACAWCRFKLKHGQTQGNQRNPTQSNLYCRACNLPLCCNKRRPSCFSDFHTLQQ
jgi:hypothetical protein